MPRIFLILLLCSFGAKAQDLSLLAKSYDATVDLTWAKVSGAQEYEVYFSYVKNGPYHFVERLESERNSYRLLNLQNETTYYFMIRAVCHEDTVSSNEFETTPHEGLQVPVIVRVSKETGNIVRLDWDPVQGVIYEVERIFLEDLPEGWVTITFTFQNFWQDNVLGDAHSYAYHVIGHYSPEGY